MAGKININGAQFSRRVSARKQASPFVVGVNADAFVSEIAKWSAVTEERLEDVINDVTAQAYHAVRARTARKTGRARSQWFITAPSRFVRFIGNNTIYIRRLEHGWSRQPYSGGMVRSVERRFGALVRKAAQKFWRFDVRLAERAAGVG